MRDSRAYVRIQGAGLKRRKPETERRRWTRLPLAIPVFVRSRDEKGKEFLEFATALNISAGGALVAVRRSLPLSAQVSLEIPSAPLATAAGLPKASRTVRTRSVRITHADRPVFPDAPRRPKSENGAEEVRGLVHQEDERRSRVVAAQVDATPGKANAAHFEK